MKALHDTRAPEYRAPYGAVACATPVTLSLDVWDEPTATVALRTWTEEEGEKLCEMKAVPTKGSGEDGRPVRFQATLRPKRAGVIWYHFVITASDGHARRYGALEGRTGGAGQLRDWEPPSFQLSAYDPQDVEAMTDDSFNNTPFASFAETTASYLLGQTSAPDFAEAIEAFSECYPAPAWPHIFNVLSVPQSDKLRLFLRLSEVPQDMWPAEASFDEKPANEGEARQNPLQDLSAHQLGVGKGRLWCASLIQALMPARLPAPDAKGDASKGRNTGAPAQASSIDAYAELGRLWGQIDPDCQAIVCNAADIRHALPLFEGGSMRCFAANDDVFGFWRTGKTDEAEPRSCTCLLINPTLHNAHDVAVPLAAEAVSEVISGYGVALIDAAEADSLPKAAQGDAATGHSSETYARVHLNQLGSALLYLHPHERLGKRFEPGMGVLAHITSLPNRARPDDSSAASQPNGTLGEPARAFVDWLVQAGVRYWQVLPVNPTDNFGSPYAGISAFAGNTRLLEGGPVTAEGFPKPKDARAYRQFCKRESDWLEPYACFMAIRDKLDKGKGRGRGKAWQEWPKKYKRYDPKLVEEDAELGAYAQNWRYAQFAFEQQWRDLRRYANERGVQIIGDMPIYVSPDSADVWADPELFQLDAAGNPSSVAGCPPDAFAAEGQVWGNPLYDWQTLSESGYDWWLRRLERAFKLYDVVRLDHFIGFARYFSIPAGEKATAGSYRSGPGIELFKKAKEQFGALPLIAEDLGLITPGVRTLVAACGFPGMDIVQFVDGGDPLSGYQPRPEKIAYSGTHDNQTLVGYCKERYPHLDARAAANDLLRKVAGCTAEIRIFPLQDLMGLDDDCRMNTPGTSEGNWTWQADADELQAAADTLRLLQ